VTPGEALDRVRPAGWRGELAGVLHEGATSRSFLLDGLVEQRGQRFVLRIDETLAAVLGLDRRRERAVLEVVAAAGLAPRVLGWWAGPPAVLLRPWVPGVAWSAGDFREPARWPPLAALLARVHALPAPTLAALEVTALDVPAAAARYARHGDAAARALAGRIARRVEEACAGQPLALCHGDPVAGNVVGRAEPCLIDWEYAALGDPLFDLAAVAVHHGLDDAQSRAWLECYARLTRPFGDQTGHRFAAWRDIYAGLTVLWLGVVERERGLDRAAADFYREMQGALDRAR
jgi:thiamine kinase